MPVVGTLSPGVGREGVDVHPEIWPVIAIIVAVLAWVVAKVVYYMRQSDKQWREVDRSKLREWRDDDW